MCINRCSLVQPTAILKRHRLPSCTTFLLSYARKRCEHFDAVVSQWQLLVNTPLNSLRSTAKDVAIDDVNNCDLLLKSSSSYSGHWQTRHFFLPLIKRTTLPFHVNWVISVLASEFCILTVYFWFLSINPKINFTIGYLITGDQLWRSWCSR